jgi:hypothetical protein
MWGYPPSPLKLRKVSEVETLALDLRCTGWGPECSGAAAKCDGPPLFEGRFCQVFT